MEEDRTNLSQSGMKLSEGDGDVKIQIQFQWNSGQGDLSNFVFFPKTRNIVSVGYTTDVIIWEILRFSKPSDAKEETHKLVKVMKFPKRMNIVCKLNESIFLLGGSDQTVRSYSIHPPFENFKTIKIQDVPAEAVINSVQLLRQFPSLPNQEYDKYVVLTSHGDLSVFSYTESKILHYLAPEHVKVRIVGFSESFSCRTFPNALFITGERESDEGLGSTKGIVLVDYFEKKIIRVFKDSTMGTPYILDTFIDKNQREIVVCGGSAYQNENNLFFYDVESSDLVKKVKTKSMISVFLKLGKCHLLVGEYYSKCEIIDLHDFFREKSERQTVVRQKEIEKSGTDEKDLLADHDAVICTATVFNEAKYVEGFTLASSSEEDGLTVIYILDNATIGIFSVKNLKIVPEHDANMEQAKEDLKERLEFLKDESNLEGFGGVRMKVKMEGSDFEVSLSNFLFL